MSVLLLTMGPQLGITADLPVVAVGGAGVIRFRAVGATGPVKWTLVDSTLPAEWDSALNPDGTAVTLTTSDAETAGTFSVTVRAVDSARIPVVRSFDVRVMTLPLTISGAFPSWEVGVPATGALTISGGVPPYSLLPITSGALPSGVSLSIVGDQIVPSGSPTVAGPWSATLGITDAASTPAHVVVSGSVVPQAGITARYWRVYVTDTVGRNGYVAIGEVAMAASIGGSDLTSTLNAIGSSQYSGTHSISKAFDNSLSTNWSSAAATTPPGSYTHWIGQDFGVPTEVAEVRITTAPSSYGGSNYTTEDPKNFALQYSDDGLVWSTAKTITNQTGWSRSETREYATV